MADTLDNEVVLEPPRVGDSGEAALQQSTSPLLEHLRNHPQVQGYLTAANKHLKTLNYTEHGERHATLVSTIASNVLKHLDISEHEQSLAAAAGYLHDIGNVINREMHGPVGALLAKDILLDLEVPFEDITLIMGAIGNHESKWGQITSNVAAALVLADKADVHRSRVQREERDIFDIHDRVNYAATHSFLRVQPDECRITLELAIDTEIASVMDYFEIFLSRMVMCKSASEYLGCRFSLEVNGHQVS